MFDFLGKVAVITGAAGNLGHTVATALHDAGAKLALVDINEENLRRIYEQSLAQHDALMIPVDLTDEQSVQEMAAEVNRKLGSIDILTNIAGGFDMGPLVHETPVEDWNRMLDINATSMFLSSRACVPYMLKRGFGRIVSVSARAALHGKARMGPYVVSKAAIIRLTETMAEEHKNDNITVNCILPGTIDTPQNRDAMPDADHDTWVSTVELANVILFLASNEARAVNGAAIPVYGRS